MFSSQDIRNRLNRIPFVPMEVVTSAGAVISIRHRELIMVGVREVTIGTDTLWAPGLAVSATRIAISDIAALRDSAIANDDGIA